MDKLKMHSPDFNEKNIAKLAELFPNCVTETRGERGEVKRAIDFDLLRQELSGDLVEGPQERYRLDWPGKREALALANAPIAKTLRPCREESVDFETTKNLYIEGDNLDALKLLQETYLGQVKMIYIDPPYNTGNDFIYDDNYSMTRAEYERESGMVDEEGNAMFDEEKWQHNSSARGRFHSEWLSMLYPRLKLAKNLLSKTGVLFVSLDNNEITNGVKVCEEVFGSTNVVTIISNSNNPKGRSDDKFVATAHEYIVVVAKDLDNLSLGGFEPEEKVTKRYNKTDSSGERYREIDLRKTGDADRREDRPNMFYYFYFKEEENLLRVSKEKDQKAGELEIIPLRDDDSHGRWRWGLKTAEEQIGSLTARFMPTRKIWGVFEKDYLSDRPPVKPTSSWTFKDVNSERGSEQFIDLGFDKEVFPRPKPLGTINRLIRLGTFSDTSGIVLDFFSGSATTAHALMALNAEDGGKRRHIAIQLPEPCEEETKAKKEGYSTIAEIGKERIRRAGTKIRDEIRSSLDGTNSGSDDQTKLESRLASLDTGFRVLKIDSTNLTDVYYQPDEVTQDALDLQVDNVKSDRTPEDLLFQVLLDWGVDLGLPITEETIEGKRVFFVADNALAACFDTGLTEDFCKALAKREPLRAVFRDAGYATDSTKINIEQIFNALSPHTDLKTI